MKTILLSIILSIITTYSSLAQCSANFTYTVNGTNVEFTDNSFGIQNSQPISWYWEFGDNTNSSEQNPTHTYTQDGSYNVCLYVYFADSCTDVYCDSVLISPVSPAPCTINISANITDVSSFGLSDGSIDIDVNGGSGIFSYNWSTGETSQDIQNLQSGWYNVTVTDDSLSCQKDTAFFVNQPPLQLSLSGNVYAKNTLLPTGIAVLVKIDNQQFTSINYTNIQNGYYSFIGLDTGVYTVFAIPYFGNQQNYYPVYFFTYAGNQLQYGDAEQIFVDSIHTKNIQLKYNEQIHNGNCYISGKIFYDYGSNFETNIYNQNWFGANKSTIEGAAQNIPIILSDSTGTNIRYVLSDENGFFDFQNIPYGEYKIHAENPGRNTIDVKCNLTENNDSTQNIVIHIKSDEIINIKKINIMKLVFTSLLLS